MTGIYKSLDCYTTRKLADGKSVKIRRLKLRDYMAFIVCYRAWILRNQEDHEALREIMDMVIQPEAGQIRPMIDTDDAPVILDAALEINGMKEQKQQETGDTAKHDDAWVISMIAFLGATCGWTKDDVMSLYPDELTDLVRKIMSFQRDRMDNLGDVVFTSCSYGFNAPGKYKEYLDDRNRSRDGGPLASQDMKKIQELEAEWLGKHYGKGASDAVS